MPKLTAGSQVTDMSSRAAMMRGGILTRMGQAVRYAIAGITPATWMSPNQPIDPQAQQAQGRLVDYRTGYNLLYTPRAEEQISFRQLRALADNCDLARLAIETRKDQICALEWQIDHEDTSEDASTDPRAQAITALLRKPDGRNTWSGWLRMLVEEVLVTDAPAIYPRKSVAGQPVALEVMDGATLKVLVDADGRMPLPPSPAFQQVLKGIPAVDYTAAEILYMPRNPRAWKFYGFSPVEQVAMTVNIAIRRTVSQLQYFTEGNVPEAFATLPTEWTGPQIEAFQKYWDATIEGEQAFKRKVKFVPGGTKVEATKTAVLQDTFDEWLARVICYAFSLPPTQFVKQATRTTSDVLQEAAESEGLAPLMAWVVDFMNTVLADVFGAPDLRFRWREQESLDPQSQQVILTGYLARGAMTLNEVREELGLDAVENGDTPLIYTATGAVTLDSVLNPPEPPPQLALDPNNPEGQPPNKPGTPPKAADPEQKKKPVQKYEHSHSPDRCNELEKVSAKTPAEKALAATFAATLAEVRDSVVKQWHGSFTKAAGDGGKPPDDGLTPKRAAEFAAAVDLSDFSLAWDDYSGELIATAADGSKQALLRIKATDPEAVTDDMLSVRDPRAVAWAKQHAADMLSSDGSGGELAESTRDMIRQVIAKGIEDKLSRAELADVLAQAYAFSEERAELIAVTEIGNATGNGLLSGYTVAGMTEKKWLLSNDENKCAVCIANAAEGYIPIGKAFDSGDQCPLAHPRCQCDLAARIESES